MSRSAAVQVWYGISLDEDYGRGPCFEDELRDAYTHLKAEQCLAAGYEPDEEFDPNAGTSDAERADLLDEYNRYDHFEDYQLEEEGVAVEFIRITDEVDRGFGAVLFFGSWQGKCQPFSRVTSEVYANLPKVKAAVDTVLVKLGVDPKTADVFLQACEF